MARERAVIHARATNAHERISDNMKWQQQKERRAPERCERPGRRAELVGDINTEITMHTTDEMHEIYQTVDMITEHLQEAEISVWRKVLNVILACGDDFALDMLRDAYITEAHGGLMVTDGSRRRTFGGVWFYLVKQSLPNELREKLFPIGPHRPGHQNQPKKVVEPLPWEDRKGAIRDALKQAGEIRIVKVTITGRPGKVIEKPQCVIMTMKDKPRTISLPKGMPTPPKNTTTYGVYVSLKHWNKVKEAIQNPDDELIISGHLAYDKEMEMVCIFATEASTRELKIAQKAE
jgi:hypothetical protein